MFRQAEPAADSLPRSEPVAAEAADRLARELDWNLLRTFVVLAEARSVTDAADRPSLKRPTVSST